MVKQSMAAHVTRWTRNALQTAALSAASIAAVGECSERYDRARLALYAAQNLQRTAASTTETTTEDLQPNWLQRETPTFPYIVATSKGDNARVVLESTLGASSSSSPALHWIDAASTAGVDALMQPAPATLDALVQRVARAWIAAKRKWHDGVPAEFRPIHDDLDHRLSILFDCLQRLRAASSEPVEMTEEAATAPPPNALVLVLGGFDDWSNATATQYLHWARRVTGKGLAHVVLPTTRSVTPSAIARWREQDEELVAILLRVAARAVDESTAESKLRVLSQQLGLSLIGLDGRDDDEANSLPTPPLPTETSVIVDTVGNWWCDLVSVCQTLEARGLSELDSEEERLALVQDVCAELVSAAAAEALECLGLFATVDASQDESEELISALDAWKCLEVVSGLGAQEKLLSPQELLQRSDALGGATRRQGVTPVEALMPFNQRAHGEAKFFQLLEKDILQLQPQTQVEIGVVPCDAKALVAPCHVEMRPLMRRAFERIWRDDKIFNRVLELERFADRQKVQQEIVLYRAEIDERRVALAMAQREFALMEKRMTKAEHATKKAELALLQLQIESHEVYLTRLRALLD
ncbi:hypothetical protein PINS_up010853 [Pythium insidiosum]|nr:hypothetical protein PINS_up010853 [Pythium insidiosum]